jgi:hypothetical protein
MKLGYVKGMEIGGKRFFIRAVCCSVVLSSTAQHPENMCQLAVSVMKVFGRPILSYESFHDSTQLQIAYGST